MRTGDIEQHDSKRTRAANPGPHRRHLYRSDQSGIYYAIFKRGGKQVKRSLKTADKELARRRLEELRQGVNRLTAREAAPMSFAEFGADGALVGGLAKHWFYVATMGVAIHTRESLSPRKIPSRLISKAIGSHPN